MPETVTTILVLTTLPDAEQARTLIRDLVEQRLVACGTIVNQVTSVYRWEGKIEEALEAQVILKTRGDRWEELRSVVAAAHPYDVPELLAVPIASGLPAYLDWIGSETGS
jgi:periplasmic divalent cation tolerance protein